MKRLKNRFYYDKASDQSCFMCDSPSQTGDHIPPKGLFATSIRKECAFLEVPACLKHNSESKKDDEYFRTTVATASADNPAAMSLIEERIIPKGSKGLIASLHESMRPIEVRLPDGKIENKFKFEINRSRFQTVIDKIVRGLYWHHNGHRIPDGFSVSGYLWNYKLSEDQQRQLCMLPIESVGHKHVFEYRYAEVEQNKNKVFLAMSFYEASNLVFAVLHPTPN